MRVVGDKDGESGDGDKDGVSLFQILTPITSILRVE